VFQLLARIGEETLNTPVYVQVEAGRCHVMTECLMRYALIGQPASATCKAVKLLQLAVFAPVTGIAAAPLCNLRVYFVDDTADAFEVASGGSTASVAEWYLLGQRKDRSSNPGSAVCL